jgi:hypothetical protein
MTQLPATTTDSFAAIAARAATLAVPFDEQAFPPTYGGGMQLPILKKGGNAWNVTQPDKAPDLKLGGRLNRVQVIFVHANAVPGRVFYAEAYKQGVVVPPTCWSADGIAPAPSAMTPQATSCKQCPQAVLNGRSYPCGKEYNFMVMVMDPKYAGFAKLRFGGGDYTRPIVDGDLRDEGFMSPIDFTRKMVQSRLGLAAVLCEMAFDSGDGKLGGHPCKPLIRVVDTAPADVLELISALTDEEKKSATTTRYAAPKNENAEALPPQKAAPRAAPRAATPAVYEDAVEVAEQPVAPPAARAPLKPAPQPRPTTAATPAAVKTLAPPPPSTGGAMADKMAALRARVAAAKGTTPAAAQHVEEVDDV